MAFKGQGVNGAVPVQCAIRPSVLLAAFLFIGHLVGVAILAWIPMPSEFKLALGFLIALSLLSFLRGHRRPRIIGLTAGADGNLLVELPGVDESMKVEVSNQTLVLPWLIVLRIGVAAKGDSYTLVLLGDSVSSEDAHRQLRRWLRWGLLAGR